MTEIQFRRGTAAAWTAANSVLGAGEPGFETDTGFIKIGDGASPWNVLAYASNSNAAIDGGAPSSTANSLVDGGTP